MKEQGHREGFSLVEVNLAILLVALGMLALFSLFPSGLREAENAMTDTHAALLGDYIMSGVEANAFGMTNWTDWRDSAGFRTKVVAGVKPDGGAQVTPQSAPAASVMGAVAFAGNKAKYILEIAGDDFRVPSANPRIRRIALWVWSGEYVTSDVARFKPKAKYYYTEVYYSGVIP